MDRLDTLGWRPFACWRCRVAPASGQPRMSLADERRSLRRGIAGSRSGRGGGAAQRTGALLLPGERDPPNRPLALGGTRREHRPSLDRRWRGGRTGRVGSTPTITCPRCPLAFPRGWIAPRRSPVRVRLAPLPGCSLGFRLVWAAHAASRVATPIGNHRIRSRTSSGALASSRSIASRPSRKCFHPS